MFFKTITQYSLIVLSNRDHNLVPAIYLGRSRNNSHIIYLIGPSENITVSGFDIRVVKSHYEEILRRMENSTIEEIIADGNYFSFSNENPHEENGPAFLLIKKYNK